MRGLKPKKSTENEEEWLYRVGKMEHSHDILMGETKLCVYVSHVHQESLGFL